MLPFKFQDKWAFISGEEVKNRLSRWLHGGHLGFPIWIILAIFLSTSHPDAVPSQLAFHSGEMKNRFSRWLPSWIYNQNDLAIFIYKSPRCFLSSFKTNGLSFQEKKRKIDFQDGSHLGFPIRTILAIFYLQVTRMLPSKFQINWPFVSEEEAKNRFSRLRPWWPSWISDQNNFSYCCSTRHPIASYQVVALQDTPLLPTKFKVNLPFISGEEAKNRFSR